MVYTFGKLKKNFGKNIFAMVNLVRAIMSTDKSDEKQMKWLKKQLRSNERDINKQRANMAPIHAAVFTDNRNC